ncbi:MAG TPA: mannonate dehydratase [Bryobacteraceae bacterium]|nr:mannonate dehydratase [Bryobacteraceae bacterium]
MQGAGAAAAAKSLQFAAEAQAATRKWPIEESSETPKLCLAPGDGGGPLAADMQPTANTGTSGRGRGGGNFGGFLDPKAEPAPAGVEVAYQRIRQLGVTHLLGVNVSGPGGVWTEESVRRTVDGARKAGLVAYNAMINLPSSVIYGKESRAKDLEPFIASIEAAGKGGLTVVEYNFYAHRATEGYYETIGRANSGYTGFDFELELPIDENGRVVGPIYRDANGKLTSETLAAFPNARKVKFKDLPPLASEGAHTLDEMWANITYFLKAVIPVAEKAGIRMALHPNDPPAPISRGSQQIMATLAGWKHLIAIVDSPANGITFDCGVTRELGEDAIATAEYFAGRRRINHVHYRNVQVDKPYEKYQEVFIDAGMNDMFGVMKALVRNHYTGTIYPEHPRALDTDRDRVGPGGRIGGYPGGGGYDGITFSVAYARAMMQAALESV